MRAAKEIPTTMGIVIILVYAFCLAVPLFFLGRSISSGEIHFATIERIPVREYTEQLEELNNDE